MMALEVVRKHSESKPSIGPARIAALVLKVAVVPISLEQRVSSSNVRRRLEVRRHLKRNRALHPCRHVQRFITQGAAEVERNVSRNLLGLSRRNRNNHSKALVGSIPDIAFAFACGYGRRLWTVADADGSRNRKSKRGVR